MAEYLKPATRGRRDPTSNAKQNGRIMNPPRFAELGGLTGPSKAVSRNGMSIVKPGGAK